MRDSSTKLRMGLRPAFITSALIAALGVAIAGLPALTQEGNRGGPLSGTPPASSYPPPIRPGLGPRSVDPAMQRVQQQQAMARNVQRQKDLVKDTDKLLALARELKDAVDKTDKNTMSLDVIKKADEIQKLAKSVRDKMKAE